MLGAMRHAAQPLARSPAARASRALCRAAVGAASDRARAAPPPPLAPLRLAPPRFAALALRASRALLRAAPAPLRSRALAAAAKNAGGAGAGGNKRMPPPAVPQPPAVVASPSDEDDSEDSEDADGSDEEFYLDVDVMIAEGTAGADALASLAADIEACAPALLQALLDAPPPPPGAPPPPAPLRALRRDAVGAELSIALCDDTYIQAVRFFYASLPLSFAVCAPFCALMPRISRAHARASAHGLAAQQGVARGGRAHGRAVLPADG
jgi:hypothetical protein